MNVPDFSEFIAILDSETVAGIMKDANNAVKVSYETRPGNDALAIQAGAFQAALGLLAVYHQWLARCGEMGNS